MLQPINHVNTTQLLNLIKQNHINEITLLFTKRLYNLLLLLTQLGIIKFYWNKYNPILVHIKITTFNLNYIFKKIIIFSTNAKQYYINIRSLTLLSIKLGNSVLLINTSYGLLTHNQALKYKVGGVLHSLILI